MQLRWPLKLAILAGLYLSQGLPYGFFTQALPTLMRQRGASLEDIGLASLLAVPWALKFAWAPLVDAHGSRRAWIWPLQLLSALLLAGLAGLEPVESFAALLVGVLLINLLSATQDIATDGLAVDLLTPSERGAGNGVQVGAYRLGMIIGGGVILGLLDRLGWGLAFLGMAGLMVLATLPLIAVREPPRAPVAATSPLKTLRSIAARDAGMDPGRARSDRPSRTLGTATEEARTKAGRHPAEPLRSFFERPGASRWLLVLTLYKAFDAAAGPMLRTLMVDSGYSLEDIGLYLGGVASVVGLAGALLGGVLTGVLGRRRALLLFGLLQCLALASYVPSALGLGGDRLLLVGVVADHLFGGMATAALFTLMMDAARPEHGATDYTLQACVVVITTGAAAALSGYSAAAFGYGGHFLLISAAGLLALFGVARLTARGLLGAPQLPA